MSALDSATQASDRSLARLAPYVAVICGATFLYYHATRFDYVASPGQIGPDAWPRLILSLMAATAAFEIVRRLLRPATPSARAEAASEFEMPHGDVRIVGACIAATVAYLLALETIGFFLGTFIYMSTLIRIGGFRRTWVTLAIAFSGSLVFMALFMRLIFVALPIGTGPFATLSIAIMRLLGVH